MNPVPSGHPGTAILLGILAVAVFLSTAATNIFALLVTLVAVAYWVRWRPVGLLRHPVLVTCMAFLGWVLVREFIGGSRPSEAFFAMNDFRPLLYIVVWAPLFVAARHRHAVIGAAAVAAGVFSLVAVGTLVATGQPFYVHYVDPASLALPAWFARFYEVLLVRSADLDGPILVGIIFGSLQLAWDGAPRRRLWAVLAVLATVALLLASARRTSQLCFVICAVLFIVLNASRLTRRARVALAMAGLLSVGLVVASPVVHHGARQIVQDVREYIDTPDSERGRLWSSGGERLRYWTVAWKVAADQPALGVSLTRFPATFRAHEDAMGGTHKPQWNPHNEYLYVLGGLGLVGLALYVALHAAVIRSARGVVPPAQRKALLLYMVAALVSIGFNSMLMDMIPGHFHALAVLSLGLFGDAPAPGEAVA